MPRRRDLIGSLGLAGVLQLLAGGTGYAAEGAGPTAARSRSPSQSPAGSETTTIPFTLEGRAGRLAVTYGVTEDPVKVGFDAIPGIPFDIRLCRGYPNVRAVIDSYGGTGYRGFCGWIQVITGKRYSAVDDHMPPARVEVDIDKLPAIADIDMPFAVLGHLPEWFDAPCRNLNGYKRLHWTADTFLTTLPIRSRKESIRRLAGFRWGYVEYDPAARRPVAPLPLEVTGGDAWNGLLPFLRKASPGWRFATA
ncbi:MAG TPA: hypothetical protein VGR92_20985 [Steroidobacteraceae bacterium]|nr:hypothetical protein [Steroidobacteraceae bacterium]